MSTWWYVIVILILVALVVFAMRFRRNRAGVPDDDRSGSARPARDFTQERETDRTGHMTAEDRTWEADSLARNRAARERDQIPPVHK